MISGGTIGIVFAIMMTCPPRGGDGGYIPAGSNTDGGHEDPFGEDLLFVKEDES